MTITASDAARFIHEFLALNRNWPYSRAFAIENALRELAGGTTASSVSPANRTHTRRSYSLMRARASWRAGKRAGGFLFFIRFPQTFARAGQRVV
jgi:hypothetical protein